MLSSPDTIASLPSRDELLRRMQEEEFDVLVIGGGATGAGTALDAATRGLKVALVEARDYASGTSAFSTKLIHGGVRYLEQAVRHFDGKQYSLVTTALEEQNVLFRIATQYVRELPVVIPVSKWWEFPWYMAGLKLYDQIAGKRKLKSSSFLSSKKSKRGISPSERGRAERGCLLLRWPVQ